MHKPNNYTKGLFLLIFFFKTEYVKKFEKKNHKINHTKYLTDSPNIIVHV